MTALYKHDPIVQHLSASELMDHPLLAHIPVWDRDSAEFNGLLESIRNRGLDYPILIDHERRVLDGRNRRNAFVALGALVPCVYAAPGSEASVIIASLVNRRHLTKGAMTYLAAPLFSDALAESKEHNLNLLRAGGRSVPYSVGNAPKTAEDLAGQMGVSVALFEQAIRLRKLFAELGEEVRSKYEPRVLGPWIDDAGDPQDPIGLGYMINGLTSMLTEKDGKAKRLGKRNEHARLFLGFLPKLKDHWQKATPEQRDEIAASTKAEVLKWPAELRAGIAEALRAAAKNDHA